jgi:hypothetical protein
MSYRKRDEKVKERLPPFVPLLKETLDAPAWKALSHGAARLYTSLKRRYNIKTHNNGHLFVSQRQAHAELRSDTKQIGRWFRELQFYGFIQQTTPGSLGVDGRGKAPHWRLTEIGYMRDFPTRDFLKWDGSKFREPTGKPAPRRPDPKAFKGIIKTTYADWPVSDSDEEIKFTPRVVS